MRRLLPCALGLLALLLVVPPAHGADRCVGVARAGCTPQADAATALAASDAGDRVLLGPGAHAGPLTVPAGVTLVGTGAGATTVTGGTGSTPLLTVAGRAETLAVAGSVRLDPGASGVATLARLAVTGGIRAEGRAVLDDTAVAAPADVPAALDVDCATVDGRGLTLTGQAPHAVRAACAGGATARVALRSSVLTGTDPVARSGAAAVATGFSAHAADADASAADRVDVADLGPSPVPGPGSPLLDRGDPAGLAAPDAAAGLPGEPFEDLNGAPRAADGDGDGVLRRDIGAVEHHTTPPADPVGNVLSNPGAEAVGADGVPVGWTGDFASAAYGDDGLPSIQTGAVLGAGSRFFAGAGAAPATLLQRIDVSGAATAVDSGTATVSLGALLGGYGADSDVVAVSATFRDPEGHVLGTLGLAPVTAAQRLDDSTLLARGAQGTIPARTRVVDVALRGDREAGTYTDAYADRLSLVLSVPGTPVPGRVQDTTPPVADLRPFSGVAVLSAAPRFSRRGAARVLVACPSSSVGRCRGTLELRASVTGGRAPARIARYTAFSVAPGKVRRVTVRLLVATRRALRARTRLKARFVSVATDGQGVQRRRVVPVRLKLPGTRRAARERRPAKARPGT